MKKDDAQLERQMKVARDLMGRYDVAYSLLAKGDQSAFMTEDMKERLAAAAKDMQKYHVRKPERS